MSRTHFLWIMGVLGVIVILQIANLYFLFSRASETSQRVPATPIALFNPPPRAPQPPATSPENAIVLPDQQESGARILKNYCAQCHVQPTPTKHSSAEWQSIVSNELKRMRAPRGPAFFGGGSPVRVPTDEELKQLRAYLTRHARQ